MQNLNQVILESLINSLNIILFSIEEKLMLKYLKQISLTKILLKVTKIYYPIKYFY